MGNCLAPNKRRCQVYEVEEEQDLPRTSNDKLDRKPAGEIEGIMKVKLVLTKEELDWLMYELKVEKSNKYSTKKLEDALAEIERNRALKAVNNANCWHPSLESIIESPEDLGSARY